MTHELLTLSPCILLVLLVVLLPLPVRRVLVQLLVVGVIILLGGGGRRRLLAEFQRPEHGLDLRLLPPESLEVGPLGLVVHGGERALRLQAVHARQGLGQALQRRGGRQRRRRCGRRRLATAGRRHYECLTCF